MLEVPVGIVIMVVAVIEMIGPMIGLKIEKKRIETLRLIMTEATETEIKMMIEESRINQKRTQIEKVMIEKMMIEKMMIEKMMIEKKMIEKMMIEKMMIEKVMIEKMMIEKMMIEKTQKRPIGVVVRSILKKNGTILALIGGQKGKPEHHHQGQIRNFIT